MVIINAGSENKGGTLEQATKNANKWLKNIENAGFEGVEMKFVEKESNGNFVFNFTHRVTGKVAILQIHGFTDEECQKFTFRPRIYWNGSSTAEPKIEDWLTDEFDYKIRFFRKSGKTDYTEHFLEWRNRFFEIDINIQEWKTKNNGIRYTTEELHKYYEKAMRQSPFNCT